MRIVVSGTHSVGKSTFVWDFIKAHPEYFREEEPYRALCDWYEIKFGKEATRFHNGIQLLHNISRVKQYHHQENVIFDRSPVDYIPYSLYPEKYGLTDISADYVKSLVAPVREALSFVDIIAYIPITDKHQVEIEDDGIRLIDPIYRKEVDDYFKQIFRAGLYDIFPNKNPPLLVEIWGDRQQRIKQLEQAIKSLA
ncbi:ATP-binding protein [Francisellaceae bacterium]|nr:ATP-binding protein [Francisellaceae bacterium]